ncbi:uncharacterized protein G2W53_001022 [Senna tora]|uniref:Uncharacterized protein n=1 Tax=Senna tora TaxID=362788 RepID=A0A834XH09_9FABA|nr:uncharacterized protein G2W53_001022 [Senna tora]
MKVKVDNGDVKGRWRLAGDGGLWWLAHGGGGLWGEEEEKRVLLGFVEK